MLIISKINIVLQVRIRVNQLDWFLSRFLLLPDLAKEALLIQVAAGGLRELLKFRLICKTTKSWVDDSPKPRAKILFSRAQVSMDFDVKTVERFLETPPPFAIPNLSLHITKLRDNEAPEMFPDPEDEELEPPGYDFKLNYFDETDIPPGESYDMWNRFCEYWTPHLSMLTLYRKHSLAPIRKPAKQEITPVIRKLLDSSDLEKFLIEIYLRLEGIMVPPYPKSFQYLSELSTGGIVKWIPDDVTTGFFSKLKNNQNLKRVSLEFQNASEIESIHELVEVNKRNNQLQLSLTGNVGGGLSLEAENVETIAAFIKLLRTLLSSEIKTRLFLAYVDAFDYNSNLLIQRVKDELGASEYWKFLNMLESWRSHKPPQSSLLELHNLENLKELSLLEMVRGAELRFPPNLLKLLYGKGFPSIGNLPLCLKQLTLIQFSGTLEELDQSLTALSAQCVNLEKLKFTWFCTNNVQRAPYTAGKNASGDFRPLKFPG